MHWLRNNSGWLSAVLGITLVMVGWLGGLFGFLVEREAEPVIQEQIMIHELKVEPRLQTIELASEHNVQEIVKIQKKLDNSLEMQKEILREVKKGNGD